MVVVVVSGGNCIGVVDVDGDVVVDNEGVVVIVKCFVVVVIDADVVVFALAFL